MSNTISQTTCVILLARCSFLHVRSVGGLLTPGRGVVAYSASSFGSLMLFKQTQCLIAPLGNEPLGLQFPMNILKPVSELPVGIIRVPECDCLYHCMWRLGGGYALVPFGHMHLWPSSAVMCELSTSCHLSDTAYVAASSHLAGIGDEYWLKYCTVPASIDWFVVLNTAMRRTIVEMLGYDDMNCEKQGKMV